MIIAKRITMATITPSRSKYASRTAILFIGSDY